MTVSTGQVVLPAEGAVGADPADLPSGEVSLMCGLQDGGWWAVCSVRNTVVSWAVLWWLLCSEKGHRRLRAAGVEPRTWCPGGRQKAVTSNEWAHSSDMIC